MSDCTDNGPGSLDWLSLNESLQRAIDVLLRAYRYASESGVDVWQFSVEWKELQRIGLASCDVRWLIARGWALHAIEIERSCDRRLFRPAKKSELPDGSCFVLSERACSVLTSVGRAGGDPPMLPPASAGEAEWNGQSLAESADDDRFKHLGEKPEWDPQRKELRFAGTVVKRFKWPAANQEMILAVFEEEGWPAHIDDPLPSVPEQDPKRRLHDTVKCLNRNQQRKLIQFRGDGTGEGVVWEPATEKSRPRRSRDEAE